MKLHVLERMWQGERQAVLCILLFVKLLCKVENTKSCRNETINAGDLRTRAAQIAYHQASAFRTRLLLAQTLGMERTRQTQKSGDPIHLRFAASVHTAKGNPQIHALSFLT